MRSVICVLALIAALCMGGLASADAAFPPLWPFPASFTNGTTELIVDCTQFGLDLYSTNGTVSANVESLIAKAWTRIINNNVFQHQCATAPSGSSPLIKLYLNILRANEDVPLQLYVDESYTLVVNSSGIYVTASTVYGAYHGLESVSQLIGFDFDSQLYSVRHAPWSIVDAPRFPHRGLLIDTSRHWLTLDYIKRVIDSVTYAKINVIHWHIVDAQAFPFDSPTFPRLGKYGAWSEQQRYTAADVSAIVEYAKERGVRVMVEFDTPGHSGSMCFGEPEVCPKPFCTSQNINNWALDITKDYTYTVVHGVLGDLASLFFEELVHLGGDEVDYDCWAAHPYIVNWLNARNLTFEGGYEYYVKRVQAMAWGLGKEVVGWEEIWNHFGTSLDKRTIIQQWLPNSVSLPLNVTSHGYRLIWSDAAHWYLDHLSVNWTAMYDSEPCNGLPEKNCKLILGGEGCMWGETVDPSDGLQTIWPRLGSIAERLWSPAESTPHSSLAHTRLQGFRCLLEERGIPAAPVDNSLARQSPPGPGSCYRQ